MEGRHASGSLITPMISAPVQHYFPAVHTVCAWFVQVLVGDVVETDNVARIFNRWSAVLECGVAAWPEMARRWVLVQEQDGLASPQGEQGEGPAGL